MSMLHPLLSWLIIFHVFGVIFWVGSLLIISSLLRRTPDEVGAAREALIVSARRLINLSANIGAIVAILFGIGIVIIEPQGLVQGWFHVKLLLVVGMLACHYWLYRSVAGLEADPGSASSGTFATIHGVVSLLLLGILAMVFARPF